MDAEQGPQTAMQRSLGPKRVDSLLHGMIVAALAEESPDAPAVVSAGGGRTFGELNFRANQIARALRSRGLQAGDGLAIVCGNRVEFLDALHAGLRAGLRVTPINWHLKGEEIAYILADCEAAALVGESRFADPLTDALSRTPLPTRFAIGEPIDGFEPLEDAIAGEPGSDIDDPALGGTMLYTSGTTGRPKGVFRDDSAAYHEQRHLAGARAGYRPFEDVHLVTGPLYHAGPFAVGTNALNWGLALVLMEKWEAEPTLELIERQRVTHTHMVPIMFYRLLGLPQETRRSYSVDSLRYVLHGAAPCPVWVKQEMIEWWGPVLYEYYAATEGGGTYITPEEWLRKPGSVGKAAEGQVVEVRNDSGRAVPPAEVGTIYMKAPERGRFEYFKDRDKTTSSYREDFFTLGDLGYFDDDGYLYVTGRSAELIISGGVNIYPAEVDEVLLAHPAVADVATIGVPNDEWGEEVKSVVLLAGGYEPTEELAAELIAFSRERLAHYKCPRTIDFADDLPRVDTGKIYRRMVRERYL